MISFSIPEISSLEGKIFIGILGFSWGSFMWEEYLAYRQRRIYKNIKTPPKELKDITDEETFEKSRQYKLDVSSFAFWSSSFQQIFNTAVMLCGGLPFLWNYSGRMVDSLGYSGDSEIPQTIVFGLLGSLVSTVVGLPWSAYGTFKIEQKHGFNKETPSFFIKDKIKKFIVSQLLGIPIMSGIVWIIQAGGDYFFVYLFGFSTVVSLALMTIYPDFIAPLFDKYEPLPEGELKEGIEAMAKSLEFPLKKLYVVEGSKRSAHSNAYLYGFHKNKRIVLYDTLIEDYNPINKDEQKEESEESNEGEKKEKERKKGCNNEEILAVLGHELGHWKLNHVMKTFIIVETNMFLTFFAFQACYRYAPLYGAFGFNNSKPVLIGLLIIMEYLFAPYNTFFGFLMTVFTRHNEFQADEFACTMGKGEELKNSLIKLHKDNLSFPVYDYLYSAWHNSHPPLLERINAVDNYSKKKE